MLVPRRQTTSENGKAGPLCPQTQKSNLRSKCRKTLQGLEIPRHHETRRLKRTKRRKKLYILQAKEGECLPYSATREVRRRSQQMEKGRGGEGAYPRFDWKKGRSLLGERGDRILLFMTAGGLDLIEVWGKKGRGEEESWDAISATRCGLKKKRRQV